MDFSKYREWFPVTRNWNYLFTGFLAPLANPVRDACVARVDRLSNGTFAYDPYDFEGEDPLSESKNLYAKLVNADPKEIAGVPSASYGINQVALMIAPKKGENVVLNDLEFHSNMYPWLKYQQFGVEIRIAKSKQGRLPVSEIEKLVDENTRVVTAAHISTWTGYREDVKEISRVAHRCNAFTVIDTAASGGATPLDVRDADVDFVAVSSHKWLMGIEGAGFLYVKRGLIDEFSSPMPGWYGTDNTKIETKNSWEKIPFHGSASKYEVGTPSVISRISVTAGMKMLFDIGVAKVQRRIEELAQYLIDELIKANLTPITPVEPELRGGCVNVFFKPGTDEDAVFSKLRANKIVVKHTERSAIERLGNQAGGVQATPSFFNTETELDQFVKTLREATSA